MGFVLWVKSSDGFRVADRDSGLRADGLHYRQPWVIGVQEELERLTKRVEEAEQVILEVSNLSKQFERLEEQVNSLNEAVYDLTVQVHSLEKVCFD
uniref:Uncharacterized protein n=1 Tax=Brassica campestris TaxID=3711 RepID=M4CVW4_BRACM